MTESFLDELLARFPMPRPAIVWKSLRVTAGRADFVAWTIELSSIVLTDDEMRRATLVHEYAHLLAFHRHGRRSIGHGPLWRAAMAELGAEPRVRHSYPVKRNLRKSHAVYRCRRCGAHLPLTRKLPKDRDYRHTGCGGTIKFVRIETIPPDDIAEKRA